MQMSYDGHAVKITAAADKPFTDTDVAELTALLGDDLKLDDGVITFSFADYMNVADSLARIVRNVLDEGRSRLWYKVPYRGTDSEEYCLEPDGTKWCARSASGLVYDGPDDYVGTCPE